MYIRSLPNSIITQSFLLESSNLFNVLKSRNIFHDVDDCYRKPNRHAITVDGENKNNLMLKKIHIAMKNACEQLQ